ncbi:mycofactocin biosynthesis glycosyltransferase MftF [Nocardia sp. NBC_00565]|uniref:mycofactocin biosynthesis glycosyltransferase MftF n=1 Tax=Nocardia sp. NBC_00565 TaxID=2975993 RepID=UPI002E808A73|nr:mycofactocin biosynthesis glycosyltransferase MftF [Nocardia sp. NBC_00565]WUC05721.1 mycofactocin biosynthesis glycosyltransferase MftF [Nocardia sp. NBC_00565]
MTAPLPNGFRITLDSGVEQLTPDKLIGGSPARIVSMTAAGHIAWQEIRTGPVRTAAGGTLARRLTDAGLAHPHPPETDGPLDVTVVIPVRDRAAMLARCLAALGDRYPVIVVDDGSHDPHAIAEVAAEAGAKLLRHPANRGPGVARNTALDHVTTELVAFLDSDCVPGTGWIGWLAPHFADPAVAAAAPRITAFGAAGAVRRCGLDLGDQPARVAPNSRVPFVPTAALIMRRSALADVAQVGFVFDPALRVGEDVDVIWRLHRAGWRIRYDPAVQVEHEEPATIGDLLIRRFRYGTSAAPLAQRHPSAIPPLVVAPGPALTVLAVLMRQPLLAGVGIVMSVCSTIRALRRAGAPLNRAVPATVTGVYQTWLGIGRYCTQFAAPLLALACATPPGRRRSTRWRWRAAAGSLLLGPAVTRWAKQRNKRNPIGAVLTDIADDIAYGAGVLSGCLRQRIATPLRPRVVRQVARRANRSVPQDLSTDKQGEPRGR